MPEPTANTSDWHRCLTRDAVLANRLAIGVNGFAVEVRSNSRSLLEKLARYYREFPSDRSRCDAQVTVIESPRAELKFPLADHPRPHGKPLKEQYVDLPDGRLVRKSRTGMVFVFGNGVNLAYGPSMENVNQVVNFINSRFIQMGLDRRYVLCHAAGVANGRRGLALAGFAGTGKSSLALHSMRRGLDLISNDRLMIRRCERDLRMVGVPKFPRVNPGTVLNNPALKDVMPHQERASAAQLEDDALWQLEQKYDVFLEQCFGPGRIRMEASVQGVLILNWRRSAEATRLRPVNLNDRRDLLTAIVKAPGLFYLGKDREASEAQPEECRRQLQDCPVFEAQGRIDFDRVADACTAFLVSGNMRL